MLLLIFREHINKKLEKKTKKKIKKYWKKIKNILVRKIYQNTQEIIEDQLEKIKMYKIEKYNSIFSTYESSIDKEWSI